MSILAALAPEQPDRWAAWRWLGTADLRVLWAIVAAAVTLAVWGAWLGWRSRE